MISTLAHRPRHSVRLPAPLSRDVAAHRVGAFEVRDTFHSPGTTYSRHDHEHPSLFVVLSGRVDESSFKTRVGCTTGSAGFLPASVEHQSDFGHGVVHTLDIVLDPTWLEHSGVLTQRYRESLYTAGPLLAAGAHRLLAACRQPDAGRDLEVEERLLAILMRTTDDRRATSTDAYRTPAWIGDVIDALHAAGVESTEPSPADNLTTLATRVGRDPAHLCRSFKQAVGCSVFEYARMIRVERATVLLRTTTCPLSRIAIHTGFTDQAHFTRVFRKHVGVTPNVYRRSVGPLF